MNKIFIVFFTAITIILSHGCSNNTHKTKRDYISVSILPQKYLVNKLLGDTIQVNVMVPEGNNPATYSPTPNQLKAISHSSLYLKIGYIGFEQAWMERIKSLNPQLKIVDTSVGIITIQGDGHQHGDHYHEGGIDPHIWTSPKTMLQILTNTKNALTKQFPEKKEAIESNALSLKNTMVALDNEFTQARLKMKSTKFIIFHPAYTYMARDYHMEQISIEDSGKEPSAKWIKEITDMAREQNIKAIFIQREFDKRNAQMIAKEIGIPTIEVNPLSENWDTEMKNTLNELIKALN